MGGDGMTVRAELVPIDEALDQLGELPSDEATSEAIASLSAAEIQRLVVALDGRLALIAGRWLLEQRRCHWVAQQAGEDVGAWDEVLSGHAETFERTTSTLRRWMNRAAEHFGLLHEMPAQGGTGRPKRGRQRRELPAPPPDDAQQRLFEPQTVDDIRQLGTVAVKVGAERWAEAYSIDEIDMLIGVLRAAKSRKLGPPQPSGGDHRHVYKAVVGAHGGTTYRCQHVGCTAVSLTKPA